MEYGYDEIMQMSLLQAWNTYKIYREEDPKPENYNKIRFGIKIKFDINRLLNEGITHKAKSGVFINKGLGIKEEHMYTELEEREKILKKALIEMLPDTNITEARGEI